MTITARQLNARNKKINELKTHIAKLEDKITRLESALYNEREWRRKFQALFKEVVNNDTVPEHESF